MKSVSEIEKRLLGSDDPVVLATVLVALETRSLRVSLDQLCEVFGYYGGLAEVLRESTSNLCSELGRG